MDPKESNIEDIQYGSYLRKKKFRQWLLCKMFYSVTLSCLLL